jgi:hypothetical protein
MPLVGLALGAPPAHALAGVGGWMLLGSDEDAEEDKGPPAQLRPRPRHHRVGHRISLDELMDRTVLFSARTARPAADWPPPGSTPTHHPAGTPPPPP